MRWNACFLVLVLLVVSFASSQVILHDSNIKEDYFYNETITGQINMTLENIDYDSLMTSPNKESIFLRDFLEKNGIEHYCSPLDCSNNYGKESESPFTQKSFNSSLAKEYYLGFFLQGKNIEISSLSLSFSPTFNSGEKVPLEIEFFEKRTWKFSEFSDSFSPKKWGCYNSSGASIGPFIKTSTYCETIAFNETGAVKTGAVLEKSGSKKVKMTLYPGDGGIALGSCEYNPQNKDDCIIEAGPGQTFSAGSYQLCIGSLEETNHRIYVDESLGATCGFVYTYGPGSSVKDYAIFGQEALYASSSKFNLNDLKINQLRSEANEFIGQKYGGDCSSGCFLPINIKFGSSHSFSIGDFLLGINLNGEDLVENKAYSLSVVEPTLDFSGTLDLVFANFKARNSGVYKLWVNGVQILSNNIKIIPSPLVEEVSPKEIPAGIKVDFTAQVSYAGNNSLIQYEWDFGDGSSKIVTNQNKISHTYALVKVYSLTLKATAGGLFSEKVFTIKAITPKEAVDNLLQIRKDQMENVKLQINSFPSWYASKLASLIGLEDFEYEVNRLYALTGNTTTNETYLTLAKDVYDLEIPINVYSEKGLGLTLITSPDEIDSLDLTNYLGIDAKYSSEYKGPIFDWQGLYVESAISKDHIILITSSEEAHPQEILDVYSIDLVQKDESVGYLVINRPRSEVFFEGDIKTLSSGQSTIIELDPHTWKSVKFYVEEGSVSFYAAPDLRNVVVPGRIVEDCNYNNFCEENLGETWKTCRADCKPTSLALLYYAILGAIVIGLIFLLKWWYNHKYQDHLFKDKNQLYNLLMYITNSKSRGLSESKIENELLKTGWSKEKVSYALKLHRKQSKELKKQSSLPKGPNTKPTSPVKPQMPPKPNNFGTGQRNLGNINKSDL